MASGGENVLFWNTLEHSILLNEVCPQGKVFDQRLTRWGFIRASLIWGIRPGQPLVFHAGKVKYHNQGFQWLVAVVVVVKVTQSCLTLATPWTVARQAPLSMEFSRQDTGVGRYGLIQGIFPIQGSNPGLSHGRRILDHLSHSVRLDLPLKRQPLRFANSPRVCTCISLLSSVPLHSLSAFRPWSIWGDVSWVL